MSNSRLWLVVSGSNIVCWPCIWWVKTRRRRNCSVFTWTTAAFCYNVMHCGPQLLDISHIIYSFCKTYQHYINMLLTDLLVSKIQGGPN